MNFDGLTVVVSPLISFMKDQVDTLNANGISAEFLNSTLSQDEVFEIQGAQIFISSFERKNLKLKVVRKKDSFPKLLNILENYKGESVIIYCFSKKDCEKISDDLNANGFNSAPYHAGLSNEKRKENQNKFINDEINIICATIAFGMGIDKPDVRLVVHYTYPKSLENYYQEAGRAGRDGLESECIMFYTYADTRKHEFFLNGQNPEEDQKSRQKLQSVMNYGNLTGCRTKYLLNYFGEKFEGKSLIEGGCGHCDNCLGTKDDFVFVKPKKVNVNNLDYNKIVLVKRKKVNVNDLDYNKIVFEKLRNLRKIIADKQNYAPFMVFGDSSLQEMAYYLPQNLEDFGKISGVGQQKLETYGKFFLQQIKISTEKLNLEPKEIKNFGKIKKTSSGGVKIGNYQKTKNLILEKKSISEIAKFHGFREQTITEHIEKLFDAGEISLENLEYLKPNDENLDKIRNSFAKLGDKKLRPIFLDLGEKISYKEIRVGKMFLEI